MRAVAIGMSRMTREVYGSIEERNLAKRETIRYPRETVPPVAGIVVKKDKFRDAEAAGRASFLVLVVFRRRTKGAMINFSRQVRILPFASRGDRHGQILVTIGQQTRAGFVQWTRDARSLAVLAIKGPFFRDQKGRQKLLPSAASLNRPFFFSQWIQPHDPLRGVS